VRSALAVLSWLVLAPLAVGLALAFGPSPTRIAAARPLIERDRDYVGSEACRGCHPDQFASWERTYHRTMTQLPEGAAVLGSFDGVAREFFGLAATPFERDGRFWMRLPDADGGAREAEVALCVGSRRYQQYFELAGDEVGGAYRRLPLLWHVAEARWMHLNGVFLGPDEPNWDAHRATWNENCIFCHNTAPVPRVDVTRPPGSRDHCRSRVAELGIACEACHGPGGAHARALAAPNARLAAYMEEHGEHTLDIVNPTRLGQHEALALCGQCHAQRLPKEPGDLARILDQGPSFRPGERLEAHVAPIERTTPSLDPARPELFAQRFWRDGTPRLTAYEYTALLRSPCLAGGEMTCSSCHSMHAGEPEGNLEPELRGDRACTQCHADIARDVRAHTHHDPAQSGARCLECHMPRIVYGVLELHRSHAIEVPDVRRDVEAGRPNTCTGCHLGESADWAAAAMQRLWGPAYARARARPDGASLALAEARASLHAGDAVQRAAAAVAFGREEAVLGASGARGAAADLAVALGDGYPSVRTLARRSLRALDARHGLGLAAELEAFDVFAPLEERRAHVLALLARLEGGRGPALDLERVRALLELQSNQVIAIGE
jgi:predicted CXXCH cytochrome family protein